MVQLVEKNRYLPFTILPTAYAFTRAQSTITRFLRFSFTFVSVINRSNSISQASPPFSLSEERKDLTQMIFCVEKRVTWDRFSLTLSSSTRSKQHERVEFHSRLRVHQCIVYRVRLYYESGYGIPRRETKNERTFSGGGLNLCRVKVHFEANDAHRVCVYVSCIYACLHDRHKDCLSLVNSKLRQSFQKIFLYSSIFRFVTTKSYYFEQIRRRKFE